MALQTSDAGQGSHRGPRPSCISHRVYMVPNIPVTWYLLSLVPPVPAVITSLVPIQDLNHSCMSLVPDIPGPWCPWSPDAPGIPGVPGPLVHLVSLVPSCTWYPWCTCYPWCPWSLVSPVPGPRRPWCPWFLVSLVSPVPGVPGPWSPGSLVSLVPGIPGP